MFYLDSYAIIEFLKGNVRYRPFRQESAVTSRANLLEVYYVLVQQGEERLARDALRTLGSNALELPLELIPTIATFRLRRLGATGRRFSYVDALGYVLAREFGYEFLTGAEEFEGLPGVRCVR